jgi:hypothetical protein
VEGGTEENENGRWTGVLSLRRVREECMETGMQAGPATGRVCSSSVWQSAAVVARVARIAVEAV